MKVRTLADNSRDVGYTIWIGIAGCFEFSQYDFQPPRFERFGGLIGHHPRQPAVRFRILDRGVRAVGGEAWCAGDADLVAILDESPVERRRHGAELDRVMGGNLPRPLRLAPLFEISGRGHHDPPHLADMARHQGGVGQMADPDREIDAVLDEVDHAIGQTEVDADVAVALQVGGHDPADMQPAEPDRRRDDELPLGTRALALDGVLRLLDIGQDPPRPLQVA